MIEGDEWFKRLQPRLGLIGKRELNFANAVPNPDSLCC